MNTSISKFLKNYYIEGVFYTHVSMVTPKGAYQLNRDSIEEFWNIYCNDIFESKKINKPICIGIGEKPGYYIPVLGDVDIKLLEEEADCLTFEDYSENEEKHLYTKKNLKDVIEVYQSVLRNIIEGCTEDMLLCVVLEKPIYRESKANVTYVKNGFHLHFPNCFLSKIDHETQLLPRVKQIMKELKIFENLGIEDSGEIIDTGYVKAPWLLYGSKKENDKIKSGETMKPYEITKIINSVGEEISIQEAFKYYNIYDVREQLINIQDKIEYYLPRILSIIPNGRMCCELKYGLSLPLKEKYIRKEKDKENFNNTSDMPVIEALKISKKLLPMLSSFRADDRNEWMTIGWVLFNIGDGCPEALEQWIEFSSRNEEKFDENECVFQWERMTKKDYTLGTLRYFAKIDNEEAYKEFTKEQGERHIRESLEGSHNDIAKLLYNEYGTEFVCSSVTNRTWYQYKNHHWDEIEEGVFLREMISNDLVKLYGKHGGDIFANSAIASPDDNSFQLKIKQTQKLISNLKNSSYKSHVMREACEVFFNKNFKNKLDSNPFLIGFKNGVYDLKLDLFRTGRPEDYISKQMPINYINFNKTDDRVLAVEDFLEKVFPDTSVRNYFLDTSSDIFEGGNKQKTINFWTGEGDNAKSVTQTILEKILGPYAIKFSTTLVTGKKASVGMASPELSRAGGGVRLAVLEEPDGDEQLNIGILKSLSGNDSYWARDLFERGKSTREIVPLFKLIFICLAGKTKISLTSGVSFSIEKLINNKEKILAWNNCDGLINIKQNLFLDKGKQECLNIKLLDGREIECTPNHKFLTYDNKWIDAKDININTELKMGINNPNCDDVFDDYNYILDCGNFIFDCNKLNDKIKAMAYVRLLGLMLTDGSFNSSLYVGHKIDCETILLDIQKLTYKRPTITKMRNCYKIGIPVELNKSFNIISAIQIGGRINNPMFLPSFLFDNNCPLFIIREFIAAFYGGDGILPSLSKNNFNNIQIVASKTEKHIESLMQVFDKLRELLLIRFGIESSIYKQEYINNFEMKDIQNNEELEDEELEDEELEDEELEDEELEDEELEDEEDDREKIENIKEKKYHVFLNINKKESQLKFCELIGSRYCCHKSYRLMIVQSWYNYKKSIIKQNNKIIKRTKELYDKYNKQNKKYLIAQYSKDTGELLKIFKSTQKAESETGIHHSGIKSACDRNGTSGGFKWEFIFQKNETLDENGCKTLKEALEQSIKEIRDNEGIIDEKYIITYSQASRYIRKEKEYKMPPIKIKEYLVQNDMFKFCNQGKGKKYHHYSVNSSRMTLPCYKMRVTHIKNSGIKNVYDINVDEPFSNFVAEGIITHNCNKLPATRNADQAFWNRAKVTPFESTFVRPGNYVPSDPSEQLLQKKFPMDTEFNKKIPNLLEPMAWKLLEHRKNIKGKGRVEPDKVKMASELYRKQNDIYRQFKDECIVESDNYITLIQLYSSFREWFKMSYPGYTMPLRNDLQEYFTKVWEEPEKGLKWYGFKVKSLEEEIEEGNAFVLGEEDLQEYDETNSICSKSSDENKKTVPKRKSPNKRILPPV
jgi:phage/plasmid-associated DNA primase